MPTGTKRHPIRVALFGLLCCLLPACGRAASVPVAPELNSPEGNTVSTRFRVPPGYERPKNISAFGKWLGKLPLKPGVPRVRLYNGQEKANQTAQAAVVDLDVGTMDLQQCADAVMRLRAEFLFAEKNFAALHFNFTSGFRADFAKWSQGYGIAVNGNAVSWVSRPENDASRASFRRYLDRVFTYAGTASLAKELKAVSDPNAVEPGDVFIRGGFPGHAVIVVDTAVNPRTGKKLFLIAQSYMPAQDIHVLRNPSDSMLNPWYDADFGDTLVTPEWTFHRGELKRFDQIQ